MEYQIVVRSVAKTIFFCFLPGLSPWKPFIVKLAWELLDRRKIKLSCLSLEIYSCCTKHLHSHNLVLCNLAKYRRTKWCPHAGLKPSWLDQILFYFFWTVMFNFKSIKFVTALSTYRERFESQIDLMRFQLHRLVVWRFKVPNPVRSASLLRCSTRLKSRKRTVSIQSIPFMFSPEAQNANNYINSTYFPFLSFNLWSPFLVPRPWGGDSCLSHDLVGQKKVLTICGFSSTDSRVRCEELQH